MITAVTTLPGSTSRRACRRALALVVTLALATPQCDAPAQAPPPRLDSLAARTDPYVARQRLVVLTDIANEPDDQMSLVRLLVYSNELDIEGLVASTSTWMKRAVRPDVIRSVLDAYATVQPNLLRHQPGFPTADALRAVVTTGQPGYGMAAVGPRNMSPGAELIVKAVDRPDPRPLWVTAWGGANTLAQALLHVRATRTPAALAQFVSKLRVYAISDQDDAGPWIRREFPALHYIASPSTQDGAQYYMATWTGISGDRFYRNAPGADFTTFTDAWVDANIRAKGPLGAHYPRPCCIHEGDTPTFLGLIDNGLASAMSPAFGGWGGRYVWRQYAGEPRPFWTQGGDAYPGNDNSRDAVVGADGATYVSDQATIWRWRTAFQHDFAARMDWTVKSPAGANHNPDITVNGQAGHAPLEIAARVGEPLALDASGTRDPDGNAVKYSWSFYPEAGTGIPGRPVFAGGRAVFDRPPSASGAPGEGGIPSAPAGGLPVPRPRVTIAGAHEARAVVTPQVAGIAHVILAVEDDGAPSLTSYRRVILTIGAAAVTPAAAPSAARDVAMAHEHHAQDADPVVIPAGALFTEADVRFMQGMIAHHGQAIHMSRMAASRGASARLQRFARKIDQSQAGEIVLMQEWLRANGQFAPDTSAWRGMSMPGMLTTEELAGLEAARGAAFDRRFLDLMIRHHEGALRMVTDLHATPRAAQDVDVSVLADDVRTTQTAEIGLMHQMLLEQ